MTELMIHPARGRAAAMQRSGDRTLRGHSDHERRVARIALKLFDLLSDIHNLGGDFRRILEVAALRHDAAKQRWPDDHDVRGAQMLLSDAAVPLRGWRRRAAAFLVRFHREPDPQFCEVEPPFRLPTSRADGLMMMLALLRAADGLDSRRVPTCAIIFQRKNRKLQVLCLVSARLNKAQRVLTRRRKFKLLRRAFDLDVEVRVEPMSARLAAAVAA